MAVDTAAVNISKTAAKTVSVVVAVVNIVSVLSVISRANLFATPVRILLSVPVLSLINGAELSARL